ncbi:hypothetical protein L917_21620 [Phytophthora nicotianae]|uniref:Uncharacterized protein n=1 Tax=Phytophthora nicotianae TaxID=4792 RepID=W2JYQ2_PHYNI|nr:hypothetical protein L917_21620 [Phytophthora nicotianae]
MLQAVRVHNRRENDIKTVVMSGLGTGSGRVQYDQFVSLFQLAYDHFVFNKNIDNVTWDVANKQPRRNALIRLTPCFPFSPLLSSPNMFLAALTSLFQKLALHQLLVQHKTSLAHLRTIFLFANFGFRARRWSFAQRCTRARHAVDAQGFISGSAAAMCLNVFTVKTLPGKT